MFSLFTSGQLASVACVLHLAHSEHSPLIDNYDFFPIDCIKLMVVGSYSLLCNTLLVLMLSLQPYVLEMSVYLKKYYHYQIIEYIISLKTHPADQ